MNNKNSSLWVSGLLTGAVLGYYLYRNRDKMPEQKEKLKTLISDLKEVALDLKSRIVATGNDAVNATLDAFDSAKETARDTAREAKDTARDLTKDY